MYNSCFASNSLIDQQDARSGFSVSGYGIRPRVPVFVGSGYDNPMDSERTPNALRNGSRTTQTRPRGLSIDLPGRNCSQNKTITHGKFIVLSIYSLDTCKM